MKLTGIVLTVIGAIIFAFMIYGYIFPDTVPRGDRFAWTYNWAPILGIFILSSGLALWAISRKRTKVK
ncbi:MAG: hypothetical protein ACNS62_21120 [Candidatus Cyclobacteriaceae bacterium M3_2C_046]